MTEQGTLIAGRYRLERRIGSGAMGVVWESTDERLGRVVAVKQLLLQPGLTDSEREEAVERTLREGRIAARLHHPNAIAVFDVVDHDGVPCLVMEYLPSRSLDDVMRERGSISPADVATIGAQVASALAAAHEAGIVHRDIKPGNVLLGRDGNVKITDFGISRATDDITVTKTGLIAGTPAYLAPEVAVGRDPAPPSDVFSLGSTLYAAVEGVPPFGLSDNTLSLLHVVARGEINQPRQAGPLTDVLLALLRADADARPDARQAAAMLRAVSQGQAPAIPPDPTGGSTAALGAQNPPTRAMTQAMPTGTRTALAPTAEEAETEAVPPGKKSRRGVWLSLLALLVLVAALLALWFSGVFNTSQPRRPHLPAPAPSSAPRTPTTTTTEPTTTTEEEEPTTTEEETTTQTEPPTTTHTEPPTTTQPRPTTTQPQPTTTAPTTTQPGSGGLLGGLGANNGSGSGSGRSGGTGHSGRTDGAR